MKTIRKIEKSSSHSFARLRVAAYCRVSTDQYEQLESLETQRSHYDEYIRAHKDWELVNLYYDAGISGTRADTRPGLQRLMADCRRRRIDMVLTKSISRFARNTADCLALVRELISLNIPIHFEKEGIDTSAMESELLLSVMSFLTESESRSISENTKWSFGKQFRNGTFKVRTPPCGYRRVDGGLQIDHEEAQIVKRIFREALSGKGASVIASVLTVTALCQDSEKAASTVPFSAFSGTRFIPGMHFTRRPSLMMSTDGTGTQKANILSSWQRSIMMPLSPGRTSPQWIL